MQNYISKKLFHFTGRNEQKEDQYKRLKSILSECKLGKGREGIMKFDINYSRNLTSNESYTSDMVCFCDIPESDLKIHMKKYSSFGISFLKGYLVEKGVMPVWYIAKTSIKYADDVEKETYGSYHDRVFGEFHTLKKRIKNHNDTKLEQFFNYLEDDIFPYMKFFDSKKDDCDNENYYMEREWRIVGVLDFVSRSNINQILVPKGFKDRVISDFPDCIEKIIP